MTLDSITYHYSDFNAPYIEWETESFARNCQNRLIHNILLYSTSSTFLTQVVNQATRAENSLDLFLANNTILVYRVETLPGVSDHDIVYIESKITPNPVHFPKRKIILYN